MKFSLCAILLALAPIIMMADSEDENWDSSFGIPGFNLGGVSSVVHHDGYTYFGGNFSQIGGIDASNIAKWDGGIW